MYIGMSEKAITTMWLNTVYTWVKSASFKSFKNII